MYGAHGANLPRSCMSYSRSTCKRLVDCRTRIKGGGGAVLQRPLSSQLPGGYFSFCEDVSFRFLGCRPPLSAWAIVHGAASPVRSGPGPMSGDAAPAQGPATADPFDAPQFDPVEYFNRHFPDEQSLTQLDAFAADLQGRIQGTDTALVESVKTQSVLSARVGGDLQRSWEAMQVLLGRVTEIQQKADDSERMVNDICSDIRALDRGKRNLTLSIKSLERLQMLHSSLQQLQDLVADPDWREVAPLVHVVKRLFAHFAEHKDIPTLQQASAQFTAMQTDFTRKITDQFTAYDPMIDGRAPDNMAHACAVIDAVGPEASKAFMHNFIQNLLEKYQRKFHHGEASAQLMNTNDRYQWFRRLLQCMNDNCPDVFPTDWCLPQELAVEFCLLTNQVLIVAGHSPCFGGSAPLSVQIDCSY